MNLILRNSPIILILFSLVTFCISSLSFVNKSLASYFTFSAISVLLFCLVLYAILKQKKCGLSKTSIIASIWGIYILIHSNLLVSSEKYYTYYLIWGILYYISVFHLIKFDYFNIGKATALFAYMGIFQACVCLLQYIGVIASQNPNFNITGTFENANITAMYITAISPYFLFKDVAKENRKLRFICLVLLMTALLLLKCRTAFWGILFIAICKIWINREYFFRIKYLNKNKFYYLISLLGIAVCLFPILSYNAKKNSANGRLFIWKVGVEMIKESPLKGFGYGMFGKEYNIGQALYFKNNATTDIEKQNARYVFMAYNEYLEQWLQGGILGCTFFVLFLICSFRDAFRQKNVIAFAVIGAISLMSLANFTIQAIPLWMFLLTCSADVSVSKGQVFMFNRKVRLFIVSVIPICLVSVLSIGTYRQFIAQLNLKDAKEYARNRNYNMAIEVLSEYKNEASTSETFFCMLGEFFFESGKYKDAIQAFTQAAQYSSSPRIYNGLAHSYLMIGDSCKAKKCLELLANMIPSDKRIHNLLNQL